MSQKESFITSSSLIASIIQINLKTVGSKSMLEAYLCAAIIGDLKIISIFLFH
jgi:hypothetical protein